MSFGNNHCYKCGDKTEVIFCSIPVGWQLQTGVYPVNGYICFNCLNEIIEEFIKDIQIKKRWIYKLKGLRRGLINGDRIKI